MVDLLSLLLSITVQGILVGAESCYDSSRYDSYFYCSSCCGYRYSEYCCKDDDASSSGISIKIAGGVFGGLIFIGIVVAVIVCIVKQFNTNAVHVIRT